MINIEQQFKNYLDKAYGNTLIPANQVVELRRCYFGAWGQFLVVLEENTAELPESSAIYELEGMKSQVGKFFNDETRGQN